MIKKCNSMAYNIPLFKLNFDGAEAKAAAETINSGWISTGPKCAELEELFSKMLNAEYSVSMTNCTAALHLCCLVCGLGPGDEVIVPSITFAASANCIKYAGATPVFCDIIGQDDMNISPEDIKRRITPSTKAIVVVHMGGFPARMDEIMSIAKENNLFVIEDACHGPLSEYKGKKLGTIGDCSAFSFFSNKNISTGEGGMFVTNNKDFAEKARLLRSHGMTTMSYQRASGHATEYDIVELGYNYRLDDIRASIAIEQLKKLKPDLEKRILVRRKYLSRLVGVDGIAVPFAGNTEFVSNYIMPVVLLDSTKEKREAVREKMHRAGIQTSVHYPAIHRFSIYSGYGIHLPVSEYVTDNELTLPMYASLTENEVDYICDKLIDAISG